MTRLRVGFLGMASVLSVRVLDALFDAGHDVRFVMRPVGGTAGRDTDVFDAIDAPTDKTKRFRYEPFVRAGTEGTPCFTVGDARQSAVLGVVDAAAVDVVVVAFFNQLLSADFLARVGRCVVNVHPSALPDLRGPSPLFWTYRRGDTQTALTLHEVDVGEDTGAVFAQVPLALGFGEPLEALMERMADVAASALPPVLRDIAVGADASVAQRSASMMRARRPSPADCTLDAALPARTAFHWVRGVGRAFRLRDGRAPGCRLIDALSYVQGQRMPADAATINDTLMLPFHDGTVTFRVAPWALDEALAAKRNDTSH